MSEAIIPLSDSIIEKLALNGDVSGLDPNEKVAYYGSLCKRVGLDPATQPFKLLKLSGKQVFYCDRGGAAQLNRLHNVSHSILSRETVNDCYVVTCRAEANSRHMDSIGAVPIAGLKGEALCNAMMKSETKAKRRATLDLLGLGMLDETEIASIPGAVPVEITPEASGRADELKPLLDATQPPKSAPEATPEPPKATPDRPKLRMATLNRLLAAPGQPNRALVTNFLFARGWIKHDELPENWPVFTLPKDKADLDKLIGEVQDFERQMREQPETVNEEATP